MFSIRIPIPRVSIKKMETGGTQPRRFKLKILKSPEEIPGFFSLTGYLQTLRYQYQTGV